MTRKKKEKDEVPVGLSLQEYIQRETGRDGSALQYVGPTEVRWKGPAELKAAFPDLYAAWAKPPKWATPGWLERWREREGERVRRILDRLV